MDALDGLALRLLLAVALAGCSGGARPASTTGDIVTGSDSAAPAIDAGAAVDAGVEGGASPRDAGAEAETYPAPHFDLPQVTDLGGPVLKHPRVVPVFYEGNAQMASLAQFFDALAVSSYWPAATAEYGVGALSVGPTVVLSGTAPATISDTQIEALIAGGIDAALGAAEAGAAPDGGTPWPTSGDGNTIYTVFFPASTTITVAGMGWGSGTSCTSFGAYHYELAYSAGKTPYAVIPTCPGLSVTLTTSHELAEAATDPFPNSQPAYMGTNLAGSGWSMPVGPEVGDLCVADPSSTIVPADVGFPVQRIWSNAAAAASRDPCAPSPAGENYFNSVPELSMAQVTPGYYVEGVPVAPGATTTVTLHLFSDGPTSGPWNVEASEVQWGLLPPDPYDQLSFALDRTQGQNGDVVHLAISRTPTPKGVTASGLPFLITSSLGAEEHTYFGMVGF